MPRVLVFPFMLHNAPGPYRDALEAAGLEVVYPVDGTAALADPAALAREIEGVDAALAGMEPFTRDVLAGSRLRVIARMGVGYDAIDVPAATDRRIAVCITPGTNEVSVAEQALGLLFGVYRAVAARDVEVRSGIWRRKSLPRIAGKTLGIVGLGRIGRAVVPRALGLGLRVIATEPCPDATFCQTHSVRTCPLDELLATADIVSLHSPASAETHQLINRRTLAMMKPSAVLINTARGSLVDEQALAEAMAAGHLLGAGLDAFAIEPLPLDSPLLKLDNVVFSPHMGGLDHESEVAMSRMAGECIARLYRGDWPDGCVVNPTIREGWKW
ncbi:MAG: phosphoglycerate dehydrogenase [Pirellulales bacterium]